MIELKPTFCAATSDGALMNLATDTAVSLKVKEKVMMSSSVAAAAAAARAVRRDPNLSRTSQV